LSITKDGDFTASLDSLVPLFNYIMMEKVSWYLIGIFVVVSFVSCLSYCGGLRGVIPSL